MFRSPPRKNINLQIFSQLNVILNYIRGRVWPGLPVFFYSGVDRSWLEMAQKWSILDQKWPNMAGLSTLQSSPKGSKRNQNGQPKWFWPFGTICPNIWWYLWESLPLCIRNCFRTLDIPTRRHLHQECSCYVTSNPARGHACLQTFMGLSFM